MLVGSRPSSAGGPGRRVSVRRARGGQRVAVAVLAVAILVLLVVSCSVGTVEVGFVDAARIGFYGLSYGGETAVRVPTILEQYCLSICSGDFNQWTRKVAATDQPFSFMRTIEWEMPYWNWGHTFDYAEMAYLMVPRPFMVERGHLDLVTHLEGVEVLRRRFAGQVDAAV